jgi:hypothetical protein
LKGHEFTRADQSIRLTPALAAEGCISQILLATFDFFRRLSISDEDEVCESRRNVAVSGTSPVQSVRDVTGPYPPGHPHPPMGVYYIANPQRRWFKGESNPTAPIAVIHGGFAENYTLLGMSESLPASLRPAQREPMHHVLRMFMMNGLGRMRKSA